MQYEGRPDAALVTFKTRREAMNAYRSTEPILNNRFIRVFWQSQPNEQPEAAGEETTAPTQEETIKEALKPVSSCSWVCKPFSPLTTNPHTHS